MAQGNRRSVAGVSLLGLSPRQEPPCGGCAPERACGRSSAHTLYPQGACGIRKEAEPLTAALPYRRRKSATLSTDSYFFRRYHPCISASRKRPIPERSFPRISWASASTTPTTCSSWITAMKKAGTIPVSSPSRTSPCPLPPVCSITAPRFLRD